MLDCPFFGSCSCKSLWAPPNICSLLKLCVAGSQNSCKTSPTHSEYSRCIADLTCSNPLRVSFCSWLPIVGRTRMGPEEGPYTGSCETLVGGASIRGRVLIKSEWFRTTEKHSWWTACCKTGFLFHLLTTRAGGRTGPGKSETFRSKYGASCCKICSELGCSKARYCFLGIPAVVRVRAELMVMSNRSARSAFSESKLDAQEDGSGTAVRSVAHNRSRTQGRQVRPASQHAICSACFRWPVVRAFARRCTSSQGKGREASKLCLARRSHPPGVWRMFLRSTANAACGEYWMRRRLPLKIRSQRSAVKLRIVLAKQTPPLWLNKPSSCPASHLCTLREDEDIRHTRATIAARCSFAN